MSKNNLRLFLAIAAPDELKRLLLEKQNYLKDKLSGLTMSWVKEEQMHLTLLFLGATPTNKVDGIIDDLHSNLYQGSFSLSLGGLGTFPNFKRPRVLWHGFGGDLDSLDKLHKSIIEALEYQDFEHRKLKPHLTLARVRRGFDPNLVNTIANTPRSQFTWKVDRFNLYKSDLRPGGAVHEVLASFGLD